MIYQLFVFKYGAWHKWGAPYRSVTQANDELTYLRDMLGLRVSLFAKKGL